MEPEQLRRGKEFHRRVQAAWSGQIEGANVRSEHMVRLGISKSAKHERRGRVDLFIEPIEDFVTVIEIKSTDWDRIDPHNRKHLLSSHTRQVLKYVDKYLQIDNVNVCAAILYPKSPETAGLKEQIEQYTGDHGLQVAWFE